MAEVRWLPLESNPDVMNKYVKALGLTGCWEFCDVFGFEPELLMMVPRPVAAVVLLYPMTDKSEAQSIGKVDENKRDVYFIKQSIGNACGTIGLIHALCNNADKFKFDDSKHLSKFLKITTDMTPEQRGKHLETDTAFGEAHEESALEGQTTAPSRDEQVKLHFVAFVHNDGGLYELDGRKDAPTCHGKTTPNSLLEDTVTVVKQFMARDPDNLNFTVVALTQRQA